jgi:hypothetical protein
MQTLQLRPAVQLRHSVPVRRRLRLPPHFARRQ